MDSEDNVGLSDIIEILNTLESQPSPEQNASLTVDATNCAEASAQTQTQRSSPRRQQQMRPTTTTTTATPLAQKVGHQEQHLAGSHGSKRHKPFIKITEQPASKALRFRYECEGRSAGSIPGVLSTPENKTFPSIEIVGYKGEVVVVVSCVTKEPPYRPHPHNLVGKEGCKDGICTLILQGETLRAVFSNLGIQCVKKKDIKAALEVRENMKVDPFKTKFTHKDQPSSIDLNSVRLCFQAFLKTADCVKPLTPVVSEPIYDKKAISDLVICRLCSCSAKVSGGDEIILLCEKVSKDDVRVRFFEIDTDGQTVWEDYAEFQHTDIHKQTAIAFKTPRYHNADVMEKTKVFIQLMRPSDGMTSEPLPFEYYPDPDQIKRKRIKTNGNSVNILRRELQKHEKSANSSPLQNDLSDVSSSNVNFWNASFMPSIKTEPALSPHSFGCHRSPYHMSTPSPQPLTPLGSTSPVGLNVLSGNNNNNNSTTTTNNNNHIQLGDMLAYQALNDQQSPSAYHHHHHHHHHQQQDTQAQYMNPNPFALNNNNNNAMNCDEEKFVSMVMSAVRPTNGTNPFIDHLTAVPTSSPGSSSSGGGGSGGNDATIAPLWITQTVQSNQVAATAGLHQLNIIADQHHHHHNHQQQMQDQLQHDIEMLANVTPTEEGPSLSGLLAFVDGEQLMSINSDDLPLSNLSIST